VDRKGDGHEETQYLLKGLDPEVSEVVHPTKAKVPVMSKSGRIILPSAQE
jgi:hypothetical protein